MDDTRFSDDDKLLGRAGLAVADHLLGRAYDISQLAHFSQALRVDYDFCFRKSPSHPLERVAPEFHVRVTIALPQRHGPASLFHHPRSQILVRDEKQVPVFRRSIDDFDGVATGANHVAERLDLGAAIDVGDGVKIRVGFLKFAQLAGWAAFLE